MGASAVRAEPVELGDIVVTAQKRAEPLQSVPVAITALGAEQLENRAISNVTEIVTKAPGVEMTTSSHGGSSAGFFIRGIGQFDFISTTDPGVGVYLDGVYIARTAGGALDLLDVDRVEVLRGPQGTLFGKNAVGGAISIYTLRPDSQDFSGKLLVRGGENARFDVGGAVNLPIVQDKVALRLSATSKNQDGYGKSLFDGQSMNDTDQLVARGALLFTPTADLSVELAADYTRVRSEAKMALVTAINPNTFVTIPQNVWAVANGIEPFDERWLSPGDYENYAGFHPGDKADVWGVRATVEWDLGVAVLKSITAYRDLDEFTGLDFDASPFALGDQWVDDDQAQFSQELIATGSSFGDRLNWASGLYYLREAGANDIYLPLSYAANPDGYDTFTTNDYVNKSYAAYAQGTFDVTDALSLTAGGRYSTDEKEDTIHTFATKFGVDLVAPLPQSADWDSFTWRLAAQYKFSENLMTYASAATGFKSGGFNGRAQSASVFLAFDPEKATTYEIGMKGDFLNRRLRLNAALFRTNYDDIQTTLNVPDPVTGVTTNIVGNPADARVQGLELEGEALVGDFLTFDLGLSYMENKYVQIVPGADIDSSDKLPNTPKWTVNAGAQYVVPAPLGSIADGEILARLDYLYKSSFFHNAQNSIYNYEDAYSIVNGRLAYQSKESGWAVSLYGKNISDERYYTHKEDLMAFVYAIALPAPPREIGIEIVKKF
jgi:iron complex outermembrane receptor protein